MAMKSTAGNHGEAAKGRGSPINPEGRFETWMRGAIDDGWFPDPEAEPSRPKTVVAIERAKSVISRNDSPDVGFSQSINPYRGCEHGCSYCSRGDTPVLMGDGSTRAIAELRVGDEIYGTRREGRSRRYVRTKVLAHWSTLKPAYRTTLEDGTTLVTSGDHRFLTERGWKFVKGAEQPEQRPCLSADDQLMGTGRFAEGPSDDDEYRRGYLFGKIRGDGRSGGGENDLSASWTKGFLAGIFDAEGSLSDHVLRICNTDRETIDWIMRSLATLEFSCVVEHISREDKKPIDVVRLTGGLREQLRFFHTVAPALTRKLNLEGQAVESDAKLRVASVESLGQVMRLYDITTGTEDFIANGVVSHNCFARPSHAYLGLSPGIDFETRLSAKTNAADVLREEIGKASYKCEPLTVGVNTDAYQPIEREHRITRAILELCHETHHPVSLITKSALIERDIDLLAPMARANLASVTISVTSLDAAIMRYMEPRASAPARRLLAIERLTQAGIPVHVNVAPVIPFLTDSELESILEAAKERGAVSASYILVRLPWEVKDIFRAWLEERFPLKAAHVMSRVHVMRGGRDNDPRFGSRMSGEGLFAQLLRQRFDKACARLGLGGSHYDHRPLDTKQFVRPGPKGQGALF